MKNEKKNHALGRHECILRKFFAQALNFASGGVDVSVSKKNRPLRGCALKWSGIIAGFFFSQVGRRTPTDRGE